MKRKNTGASGNPVKKQNRSRAVKSVQTKKSTSSKKISTESQRCLTAEDQNFDIISWVGLFSLKYFLSVFKLHLAIPKLDNDGNLTMRIKRALDHVCVPELIVFLCDHERSGDELFQNLKRKLGSHNKDFETLVLFLESVQNTSQAELRKLNTIKWRTASESEKLEQKARFDLSVKTLLTEKEFSFDEFAKRLDQVWSYS